MSNRTDVWGLEAWLVCACLFGVSCGDDGDPRDPPRNEADAAVNDASILDAGPQSEPVDQTPPSGANGLAFDGDGKIWVADLFGRQLLRIDPGNGEILDRFVQDGTGLGADDIAVDAKGFVFWTDFGSGRVGRFDPKTHQNEFVATLPTGANSIAFSEDGRLFVGLVLLNRGLYEIDPEGSREPRLITDAISSLNAFDFGPDGLLWGPLEDAIVKLDLERGEVVETVAKGRYASVRYNARDGALYALTNGADRMTPALHKIDIEGFAVSTFHESDLAAIDNFVIGPKGEFIVTGYNMPKFEVIESDGAQAEVISIGYM